MTTVKKFGAQKFETFQYFSIFLDQNFFGKKILNTNIFLLDPSFILPKIFQKFFDKPFNQHLLEEIILDQNFFGKFLF